MSPVFEAQLDCDSRLPDMLRNEKNGKQGPVLARKEETRKRARGRREQSRPSEQTTSPRQISVAILAECQSYAFPNLAFVIARPPSTQDFPREKFGFRIANT